MDAAPNLPIVPAVIEGSWRVFQKNMFPVPYGASVRIRFGEPISRVVGESPVEILEQCRTWIESTLDEWRTAEVAA